MEFSIKQAKTEKGVRNVYLLAFTLLLISYLVNLYANKILVKQSTLVEHTNLVITKMDGIMSKIVDGETASRGYVLTKDIEFLYPYYGTFETADSLNTVLLAMTKDNTAQQGRLKALKRSIYRRFEIMRFSLKSFNDNNRQMTDTMTKLRSESKKLMDHIRANVATLKREEEKLLFQRESKMKGTIKAIAIITVISLSLAFALLFFGFITYRRVSIQREISEKSKIEYQTQLKKRIEELNKANSELIRMRSQEKFAATGRIARTIAHEVRNPLTNINLAADQLKSEVLPDDENASPLFEMIARNSHRINQLISDLLNSTKFSELTYTKIPVNDLLDETLQEANDRISLNHVRVVKKYTSGVCDVSVDKERIKIAFLNIIINAVEAMENKEGSVLTLETKEENNKCQVIITDNGPGLDNEALTRLFEPYFTSKPKGNGLGLTNTQNIILNHKGEISVESTKGKGVIFTITLNCAI
jgi:signal transduction histidine kinase